MFGPYPGRLADHRVEASLSGVIPGVSQGTRGIGGEPLDASGSICDGCLKAIRRSVNWVLPFGAAVTVRFSDYRVISSTPADGLCRSTDRVCAC